MQVVVTTGAIRRAKFQSNHHHQQTITQLFTGWVMACWWWWFDWNSARFTAPVVITTCILLIQATVLKNWRKKSTTFHGHAFLDSPEAHLRSSDLVFDH